MPTVTVLHMSDAAFRAKCKAQCGPYQLTYRVRHIGPGSPSGGIQYPADCYCIRLEQRTVVEKLRDLIW